MPRRTVVIVLAVLVMAAILAGGLYWRWINSPRYALQQMVLSLKTKDMPNFFKSLDLKEIFNNLVQSSTKDLESQNGEEMDEWSRLTQSLGQKFARRLLPKLFEVFEKQIRDAIETYLLNLDNSQILGLTALITLAKIEVKDEEARVTLHDPKTGDPLRFKMRHYPDRTWRIVKVNYQDLKKFMKREFHGQEK
jgi:hypothetical protein